MTAPRHDEGRLEIGYLHNNVPIENAAWYVVVTYRGHRLITDQHRSPSAAATALAERLLGNAQCRCGQLVTLSDEADGCRWRLVGKRWEPGCDAPKVTVAGVRGDHRAMARAFAGRIRQAAKSRKRKTDTT